MSKVREFAVLRLNHPLQLGHKIYKTLEEAERVAIEACKTVGDYWYVLEIHGRAKTKTTIEVIYDQQPEEI
jgi:hypothetical protein